MSKLVFVNRYYAPDESATSQLLGDLARACARDGRDVHVVASRQLYHDPGAQLDPRDRIDGVTVHRVLTTRFGRWSIVGRLLDYVSFHVAVACALLRLLRRGDIVVAKTDPPLISVVAAACAATRGAAVVNWLQDLFPEAACALGVRIGRHHRFRGLTRLRDWSLERALVNVTIGQRMREQLRSLGLPPGRLRVIHNWSDGQAIVPTARDANPLRREWSLQDRFVVGYSGNLGRAHDLDTLLDAACLLKDRDDIRFLFVCGPKQLVRIAEAGVRRGLRNLVLQPFQPRERLAHSLTAADLHIVSLRPALEGFIVPSKFYGIAAAGRPAVFIGDQHGEIARIVKRAQCGEVVAPGDAQVLAERIAHFVAHPQLVAGMGANAREVFERQFDMPVALRAWERVLAECEATVAAAAGATPATGRAASQTPLPTSSTLASAIDEPLATVAPIGATPSVAARVVDVPLDPLTPPRHHAEERVRRAARRASLVAVRRDRQVDEPLRVHATHPAAGGPARGGGAGPGLLVGEGRPVSEDRRPEGPQRG